MYTIKQASIRTGVGVPLLRAWERRYGIPAPARTGSGYRLYDDLSLERVRRMRLLVESGMAPRQAADSILEAEAAGKTVAALDGVLPSGPASAAESAPTAQPVADQIRAFVGAAAALDGAAMEALLSDAVAALGVDETLERFVLPAMVAVGEYWARGELSVAAEHAASGTVQRRLSALFEAASSPAARVDVVVGLAAGSRHEIGALAFAVACGRAGLRVLYLGADVPVTSWLDVVREQPDAAIVLGAVTAAEADAALEVVAELRRVRPETAVAIGGAGLSRIAGRVPAGVVALPGSLHEAVALLADMGGRRAAAAMGSGSGARRSVS